MEHLVRSERTALSYSFRCRHGLDTNGSLRGRPYRQYLVTAGPDFKPICMKNDIYTGPTGTHVVVRNIYIGNSLKHFMRDF